MDTSKYLAIGSNIANKYEVMDVLGEDEFEILYLVRDTHRKGSFFVLKELFLETFSSRTDEVVFTTKEAIGVFNKRRIQIIDEINTKKVNTQNNEIKIYGYEEFNETIYTIMEFSNNSSLEKYLQFIPKGEKHLPSLSELIKKENKSVGVSFVIKIFLLMLILLGIAFYTYKFFQKNDIDKDVFKTEKFETRDHPILKDRRQVAPKEVILKDIVFQHESKEEVKKEIQVKSIEIEQNISIENKIFNEVIVASEPLLEIPVIKQEEDKNSNSNNILSEVIVDEEVKKIASKISIEIAIKNFLDMYISASSHSSSTDTLRYYDKKIKRYFKFRNPSIQHIRKSQERYNKKWTHRNFNIVNFEIIKIYKKNNLNYYDLKTTTLWDVSNKKGKQLSGQSKGFMTLKQVDNSFKINSIYTLN